MNDIENTGNVVQTHRRQTYVLTAEIQSGQTAAISRHTKPKVTTSLHIASAIVGRHCASD